MLSLKCLEKSSLSCWKKSAPVPKKKTEWYVSKPQSLLYQVQQQHFKYGLICISLKLIICHSFHGFYMSCIPWQRPVFTCIRQNIKAALSVTFDLLILKIMFLFFKNTVKILKFR